VSKLLPKRNGFTLRDLIGCVATVIVILTLLMAGFTKGPIIMRGFQKYGIITTATGVLILEALEKQNDGKELNK